MRRVLRSKPVLIIGGGAVARRLMNKAQIKRKKRKGAGRKITGLVLASAAGGAFRYFTDSVSGPRRRQKVMRMMGKAEQGPEWSGGNAEPQDQVQMQDATADTTPPQT